MSTSAGARQSESGECPRGLFALAALVDLEARLSPRMKGIVRLLRLRGSAGATSWELLQESRSVAVHSTVSELRGRLAAIGWEIRCEREPGPGTGPDRYRYRLVEKGPA